MTLHSSLLQTPFVPGIFQNRLLVAACVPGLASSVQKAIWGSKAMLMTCVACFVTFLVALYEL